MLSWLTPLLQHLKDFSRLRESCLGKEDLHDTQSHASNQYLFWKVYLEVKGCFEVIFKSWPGPGVLGIIWMGLMG